MCVDGLNSISNVKATLEDRIERLGSPPFKFIHGVFRDAARFAVVREAFMSLLCISKVDVYI